MKTRRQKQFIAALMGLMLMFSLFMGTGVKSFATVPASTDTHSFTINNVDNGSVAKAYKIIEPVYGTYGVTGYQAVSGVSIADISAPTKAEIETIVTAITGGTTTLPVAGTFTAANNKITGSLGAGSYIVVLTSNEPGYEYNPVLVSLQYANASDASTLGQTEDEGDFTIRYNDFVINSTVYWAKRVSVNSSTERVIYNNHCSYGGNGDAARFYKSGFSDIGDEITFVSRAELPKYSALYNYPQFWIKDVYERTFNISSTNLPTVKLIDSNNYFSQYSNNIYNSASTVSADDYTISFDTNGTVNWYTIKFGKDFLMSDTVQNMSRPCILVEYTTSLNDIAPTYYCEDSIESGRTFMNDLDTINDTKVITYRTIDMYADSTATPVENNSSAVASVVTVGITQDISKVSDGGSASVSDGGNSVDVVNPLAGATFKLTKIKEFNLKGDDDSTTNIPFILEDYNDTTPLTYTTTSDGFIKFEGLGVGVYKLEEIEAPTGYTLNPTPYYIAILRSAGAGDYYTYVVAGDSSPFINTSTTTVGSSYSQARSAFQDQSLLRRSMRSPSGNYYPSSPVAIVNSSMLTLPTTGGSGTTIIIIAGAVLVLLAIILVITSNRNKEKTHENKK